MHNLDQSILASAKNTNSWLTSKGDLHRAFPLDILMVPSSVLAIAANSECLSCSGFSLGETIRFGSLEFIINRFGGLSLSPMGDGSNAIVMGSTCGEPPSPLWAMMGDSVAEFHMASDGEGKINLLSTRRYVMGASPAPATTISRLESTPTARAPVAIPSRQAMPWLDTNRPSSDGAFIRRGNEHKPTLSHPTSSRRQHNDGMN
jgi:hypothetical protein